MPAPGGRRCLAEQLGHLLLHALSEGRGPLSVRVVIRLVVVLGRRLVHLGLRGLRSLGKLLLRLFLDVVDLDVLRLSVLRALADALANRLRLLDASKLLQPIRTHRVKPAQGLAVAAEHHDRFLDHDQAQLSLAHLVTDTGDHHRDLGLLDVIELTWVRLLGSLERTPEVSQSPLTVGLDSPVQVETGQTPGGADVTQGLLIVTREIGGHAGSLTHHGHPAGVRGSVTCVLEGQLGVRVQQALHHDEVPRDVLSVGTPQSPQLAARRGLQVRSLNLLGNRRLRRPVTLRRPGVPTFARARVPPAEAAPCAPTMGQALAARAGTAPALATTLTVAVGPSATLTVVVGPAAVPTVTSRTAAITITVSTPLACVPALVAALAAGSVYAPVGGS